jgi:hypothetical protein
MGVVNGEGQEFGRQKIEGTPFILVNRAQQTFEEMAKDRNLDPEEIRPVYVKLLDRLVEERDKQPFLKLKMGEG